MTTKWQPISGDFYAPGNITISADELGITINKGRKALATSEWPGEDIRLCQKMEEADTPHQIPEEVYQALGILLQWSEPMVSVSVRGMLKEYYVAHETVREWAKTLRKDREG